MGPAPAPRPVPGCPVRGLELLPPPQDLRVQVFPVVVDVILQQAQPGSPTPSQDLADRRTSSDGLSDPHTFIFTCQFSQSFICTNLTRAGRGATLTLSSMEMVMTWGAEGSSEGEWNCAT